LTTFSPLSRIYYTAFPTNHTGASDLEFEWSDDRKRRRFHGSPPRGVGGDEGGEGGSYSEPVQFLRRCQQRLLGRRSDRGWFVGAADSAGVQVRQGALRGLRRQQRWQSGVPRVPPLHGRQGVGALPHLPSH